MSGLKLKVNLTPKRLASILLTVVSLLLLANLLSIYFKFSLGRNHTFFHTFYFDAENNLPTLYSFLTLALCGAVLWITGSLDLVKMRKQTAFWRILSSMFFFLAVDELTSLHETLSDNARDVVGDFNAGGYLHFAWVLPYGLFFAFLLVLLLRQFMKLPFQTRVLFIIAGIVYVFGAVGMEMIGGRYIATHGLPALQSDINYALITTLEELLEMIGIIIFLYALAEHYLTVTAGEKVKLKISLKQDERISLAGIKTPLVKPNDKHIA